MWQSNIWLRQSRNWQKQGENLRVLTITNLFIWIGVCHCLCFVDSFLLLILLPRRKGKSTTRGAQQHQQQPGSSSVQDLLREAEELRSKAESLGVTLKREPDMPRGVVAVDDFESGRGIL